MQITIFPLFIEGGVLLREKKIHQKKISQAIHAHTHNGMAQWKQFSETYLFFDIVRKNKLIICSKLWLEFMTTDRNASYKISIYASKFQVANIWEFENTKLEQHEVIFFLSCCKNSNICSSIWTRCQTILFCSWMKRGKKCWSAVCFRFLLFLCYIFLY